MIQFPETAQREWKIAADAAYSEVEVRKRIEHDSLVESDVARLRRRHEANLLFQQELAADETPTLEMATLAEYVNDPGSQPVDLIDGVAKDRGLTTVVGPSGSGKSTLALQMVHSLLTGTDWLGQPAKPLIGAAGVLSYDMEASMVVDWMSGYPHVDHSRVSVVNAHNRGNPLGVPEQREMITKDWVRRGVEVVVIDSFSASFRGYDQNDAAATMNHYQDLMRFALTEVGARSIIVIAHSTENAPGKIRGSTVHQDVADSIVVVDGAGNDPRHVRMAKYREARGQKQMDQVIATNPDAVTHLVGLDPGAMALEGLPIPQSYAAELFKNTPDAHETPDTESEDESL